MRLWLRRIGKWLPLGVSVLFALQVLIAVPQHSFHTAAQGIAQAGPESAKASQPAPSLPEDCHCDFCLALSALDSGSATPPALSGLVETAFSVVAAYRSFDYSHPQFFALARGPPLV